MHLIRSCLISLALCGGAALAQPAPGAMAPTPALPSLPEGLKPFAVEFRTGPAWRADKPAQEQAQFREHSANLRRLREAGLLVLGARIAERGFIVLAAADEAAARAEIEGDPAVQAGVFQFTLSPMAVFYGGTVPAARR